MRWFKRMLKFVQEKKEEAQVNSRLKKKKTFQKTARRNAYGTAKREEYSFFFFFFALAVEKRSPITIIINEHTTFERFTTSWPVLTGFRVFVVHSLIVRVREKKKDRTCFLTAGFRRLWQLDGRGRIIKKKEQKKRHRFWKKKKLAPRRKTWAENKKKNSNLHRPKNKTRKSYFMYIEVQFNKKRYISDTRRAA